MLDYKKAGQRIHTRRKILNLTQEVVSERIGVTPSYFSQIESGSRKAGIKTFVNISKVLGVSLDYILDIETNNSLVNDFDSVEYQILNQIKDFNVNDKQLVLDMVVSIQKRSERGLNDGESSLM